MSKWVSKNRCIISRWKGERNQVISVCRCDNRWFLTWLSVGWCSHRGGRRVCGNSCWRCSWSIIVLRWWCRHTHRRVIWSAPPPQKKKRRRKSTKMLNSNNHNHYINPRILPWGYDTPICLFTYIYWSKSNPSFNRFHNRTKYGRDLFCRFPPERQPPKTRT